MNSGLSLAVVVPAYQAEHEIGFCLQGLLTAGFAVSEVLVVDDGSRDGTGDQARTHGLRVIRNDKPLRPALARNRGVAEVDAEVVVFVDADVVVAPDARSRITAFFATNPGHVAVFGCYDYDPASSRPTSVYRNLLHHWVHQHAHTEAGTFWTGIGAVRRQAFVDAGGLDPRWEAIEDVELGLRLCTAGGRIRLDASLQGKHLKDWTLRSMLRTDWKGRALPWGRLIRLGRTTTGDLNTSVGHKASAALVAGGAPEPAPRIRHALGLGGGSGMCRGLRNGECSFHLLPRPAPRYRICAPRDRFPRAPLSCGIGRLR